MISKGARRAAVWSYFAPIVVLFLVIGVALVYWVSRPTQRADRPEQPRRDPATVGTFGSDQGGFDPATRPGDVRAEIRRRGEDLSPVNGLDDLRHVNGVYTDRPVDLKDVKVESADGNRFWVRDGHDRIQVLASDGAAAVKPGTNVDVAGRVERNADGTLYIRASRIQTK
ncbi:MAG TPA: hypothetical protein VL173_17075 [Vicinamibacterales bacterium]|jgi:hypothetical protein|nr:hypothetical protein [Vicinamibacterales bacterium]